MVHVSDLSEVTIQMKVIQLYMFFYVIFVVFMLYKVNFTLKGLDKALHVACEK